jgi:hypothetical protein
MEMVKWWNGLLDEFWTIPGSLDGRKSGVSPGVFVAFQLWFWMVYHTRYTHDPSSR